MSGLEPIERPNGGGLYRPRKINCHAVADEHDDVIAVIVFGTHDIERARSLAESSVRLWVDDGCTAGNPHAGWWRDGMQNGDRYWIDDEVAGRAGVRFEVVEVRT